MSKLQMTNYKLKTKKYKVGGMNCASCATLLELDLEDAGLKCNCNYAKSELEIDSTKPNHEEILKKIANKSNYTITPY